MLNEHKLVLNHTQACVVLTQDNVFHNKIHKLVLQEHKINLFLQYETMLKMSVPSPPLLPLYFPTPSFTRVPTLWKTATRAVVVVREAQKTYWSGKCNPLAEDAGVLGKYTAERCISSKSVT